MLITSWLMLSFFIIFQSPEKLTRSFPVVNIDTALVLTLRATRNIDGATDQSHTVRICSSDLSFLNWSQVTTAYEYHVVLHT